MKTRRAERLLELDDVERRLKPFRRRYLAVRAIPLEALVGTDGRANAFTRDFRPLHAFSRDRLRSLRRAFGEGGYPPIVAVKLGDAYSVIDGHHRAALARRSGAATIDADVTELLENIQVHGYHLMRGRGRVLAMPRSQATGTTRSTRRRSPRSNSSAALTGTWRRASSSSGFTGTGGTRSPRSAVPTLRRPSSR